MHKSSEQHRLTADTRPPTNREAPIRPTPYGNAPTTNFSARPGTEHADTRTQPMHGATNYAGPAQNTTTRDSPQTSLIEAKLQASLDGPTMGNQRAGHRRRKYPGHRMPSRQPLLIKLTYYSNTLSANIETQSRTRYATIRPHTTHSVTDRARHDHSTAMRDPSPANPTEAKRQKGSSAQLK